MEYLRDKGLIESMKIHTDKHRDNIPGKDVLWIFILCINVLDVFKINDFKNQLR